MFKKLQDLLFEDEEDYDDEEEEEIEEVKPSKSFRKKEKPVLTKPEPVLAKPTLTPAKETKEPVIQKPAPIQQPAIQKPTLNRIDVTQDIPTPKISESGKTSKFETPKFGTKTVLTKPASIQQPVAPKPVAPAPVIEKAAPKPIETPVKEFERPKSFGITLDERTEVAPAPVQKQQYARPVTSVKPQVKQTVKPVSQPVTKPVQQTAPRHRQTSVYEFRPVISPMFGVDEKDLDSLQITASKAKSAYIMDKPEAHVLSPMYGSNKEAVPSTIQSTVEKSNAIEQMSYTREAKKTEETISNFSLDDILSARDEEFAKQVSLFSEGESTDIDETFVIDSNHLNSYKGPKFGD